ncbi:GntR family transcriptional regulator [Aureimonas mangrovi]|uniref:GntR family transcriptional regulator n=1 Tax=Aureimonas mangrovi TaxID=2758041 RepID=UPI00163D485C|nr:GntR family transcriptional regulator [Aureimonas mangrovi]
MGFTDFAELPLASHSLADQVRARLEDMLCSGVLKPEDRTSIRELAEAMGVSTMPVRDAVSRLVAGGALAIERNRAVVVPKLSIADFQDLTEARILTEAEATRRAAQRMTPEILNELRRINDAFVEAMGDPGSTEPVPINQRLHFCLYDAAGSATLSRIIASNWLRAGPMINLDIGMPTRRSRNASSMQAHAALLLALEAGDVEGAAAAVTIDIQSAAASIIENALGADRPKED